jgi:PAS domain-containing protein
MAKMFGVSARDAGAARLERPVFVEQEYLRVAEDIAEAHERRARLPGRPADAQAGRQPVLGHGLGQGGQRARQEPGQRLGRDGHHPRKELEAALARTSSEREAIFNSALVGISFNVDRRIQWVNDKYQEMTGYSREELVGKSSRMLYDDDATYRGRPGDPREAGARRRLRRRAANSGAATANAVGAAGGPLRDRPEPGCRRDLDAAGHHRAPQAPKTTSGPRLNARRNSTTCARVLSP